jgi:squalene synthase HpnC
MGGGPGLLDRQRVRSRARQENFPVASRLLPLEVRSHLYAVYGFARLVDDTGDQAPGDRLRLLDRIESELDLAVEGRATDPIMRTVGATIRELALPLEPFRRLIEANRRDQAVSRYETFDDLLAYCELSANPVGHLVLLVFCADTPRRRTWSDAVCTGLQLTEHWQDVAEDAGRGRVYLPQEDLRRFGCSEEDLTARRPTPAFRRLMAFEVERARELLGRGLPLASDLGGRAGFAVASFVAGGRAALTAIERASYDVLTRSPRPSRAMQAGALVAALAESRRGRRAA